ncbi:23S rRNA (guanosine(2251)-2'-O)-methyltransferase RlmB [Aestuariimicrobium ganziense]|uniref:23S rRNA (guanosine(2251)-2'-O)-methyltransferase RlmB n=1 Tax=Aestuariimicrobium ganziense TaxID=2773677 RepID=UPI001945823F|nr:23S rRNA (guanosine(2251)-2'-O)-methyltransferase RlmB [Aestuariimicrobium ganziense]
MAGNSQRRGATTKGKGRTAGSGGRIRRSLEGKGPTPKAEDRVYHKAHQAKKAAERQQARRPRTTRPGSTNEWIIGRNPVLEALEAGLPVRHAYLAEGAERDNRLRDILTRCAELSIPLMQVTRVELDRLTGGLVHQGVALQIPPFEYDDPQDLLGAAATSQTAGLIVALDQITDPRNLGAIIRSAAAFGADGVVIPSRRSASMTAAAWKTSAGAAARLPVAQVGNLNRFLEQASKAGFTIAGLAGEGETDIAGIPGVDGPLVLVVGSEGEGLARLVREHCDHLARIPIASEVESLNASVAAAIALYEVNRCRGTA